MFLLYQDYTTYRTYSVDGSARKLLRSSRVICNELSERSGTTASNAASPCLSVASGKPSVMPPRNFSLHSKQMRTANERCDVRTLRGRLQPDDLQRRRSRRCVSSCYYDRVALATLKSAREEWVRGRVEEEAHRVSRLPKTIHGERPAAASALALIFYQPSTRSFCP